MKKIKNLQNISIYFKKKYMYSSFILLTTLIFVTTFTIIKLNKKQDYTFDTLQSIKKYVNFYPENYDIENNDWIDPSFMNFYKTKLRHSVFNKTLVKIGIKKDPIFNIQDFDNLIKKVTKERIDRKLAGPDDKKIKLNNGDKCIIFGCLHSAIHSLYRDLNELEKQKIINNNFNIISPNTYIIILGDAIDRAPYSLEVLNVLLILLDKNPEKVCYLKGNHEANKYWRNFNTRRQIQVIFPDFANLNKENNLFDSIDNFFNTLSSSITIDINGKNKDQIILSYTEKQKLYENKNNVKFMIIGEKRFDVLKPATGLEFIGYENGIAKWSAMACPTAVYKKFFNFHYDAFIELLIGKSAQECTLTLNNRDTREKSQAYKQTLFEPVFGHKIKNENTTNYNNFFKIGSSMGVTGIVSAFAKEYKSGLEAAIYYNNKNKKNLIKPIIFDDEYIPRIAKININRLLNDYSIKTIVSPQGTPTLAFYLDMVKEGLVSIFFPYTGSAAFRNKDLKNILHFRPSYPDEAITLINYIVKNLGIKNFAFFYQNDAFGIPIAKAAGEELKKLGISTWLELPHTANQTDFRDIKAKINSTGPDAIALFSNTFATAEFIDQLGPEFFAQRTLFGISFIFSDPFCKFLNNRGIKYLLDSIVPSPTTSSIEIVSEFRKNMSKQGLSINSNSLEGYISGSLIADAISKIKPPVTEKKIMQHFENMKNYKYKGLNLTFDPEKRDLSQPVWLRTKENKWINTKY